MNSARCWIVALPLIGVFAGPFAEAPGQVVRPSIRVSETSFDKTNFGQLTVTAARNKAEESLRAYLMMVDKAVSLSSEQYESLALAGRLDIHRFFAEYAGIKRTVKFTLAATEDWQQAFQDLQTAVKPLRTRFESGLHDESSLLAKTIVTSLRPEQREQLRDLLERRLRMQYEHQIRVALGLIDYKLPLTDAERIKITKLLSEKTEPLVRDPSPPRLVTQVLGRMALIEMDLQEILPAEEVIVLGELIRSSQQAEVRP